MNLTERIASRYIAAKSGWGNLSTSELNQVAKGLVALSLGKLKFKLSGPGEWSFEDEASKVVIKVELKPAKTGTLPVLVADVLVDKRTQDGFETSVRDVGKLEEAFKESLDDIRGWVKRFAKK